MGSRVRNHAVRKKTAGKERNTNFEVLRILCMFMIVAFHMARNVPTASLTSKIYTSFLGSWGLLGVNCFVAISAYFSIGRKFHSTHFIKILLQFITYCIVFIFIATVSDAARTGISPMTILWNYEKDAILNPFWSGRYWFITAYLLLCLFIPFLNVCISKMNHEIYRKLMIVLTVSVPVYGTFQNGYQQATSLAYFIYVYLLINFLEQHKNNWFERNARTGFLIGASAFAVLSVALSYLNPSSFLFLFMKKGLFSTDRYSITMIFLSVLLFYIFKNLDLGVVPWINQIASLMLGVYLFHENPIFNLCDKLFAFFFLYIRKSVSVMPYLICYCFTIVFVFAAGCAVEWIRQHTIEKPLLNLFNARGIFQKMDQWFNVSI